MCKRIVATVLFCLLSSSSVFAINVPEYPVIGKPCPYFSFSEVYNFRLRKITNEDLKGKWFVLDFWGKDCTGCIKSFPKINKLQEKFKDSLQVLLVGYDEKESRPLYNVLYNQQKLILPCAFDTATFKQFGVREVPHLIVVNSDGIVEAVTSSINEDQVSSFLKGEKVSYSRKYNIYEKKPREDYNKEIPLLVNGNGGDDIKYLYRSILVKWNSSMPIYTGPLDLNSPDILQKGRYEAIGMDLPSLYRMAYTGRLFWGDNDSLYGKFLLKPVLEVKDSTVFFPNKVTGDNAFSYSLIIPKERCTRQVIMGIMQSDLYNTFGYDAKVEKRLVDVWKLKSTRGAKAKLKTKGGKPWCCDDRILKYQGFFLENMPASMIINSIVPYLDDVIIIDETNFGGNIDITINADMLDFQSIKSELAKQGLILEQGKQKMDVIVIRDSANN